MFPQINMYFYLLFSCFLFWALILGCTYTHHINFNDVSSQKAEIHSLNNRGSDGRIKIFLKNGNIYVGNKLKILKDSTSINLIGHESDKATIEHNSNISILAENRMIANNDIEKVEFKSRFRGGKDGLFAGAALGMGIGGFIGYNANLDGEDPAPRTEVAVYYSFAGGFLGAIIGIPLGIIIGKRDIYFFQL
ncbi:MAG: hypothetical protein AB7T22_10015 [Calditrichaceae bacterium]